MATGKKKQERWLRAGCSAYRRLLEEGVVPCCVWIYVVCRLLRMNVPGSVFRDASCTHSCMSADVGCYFFSPFCSEGTSTTSSGDGTIYAKGARTRGRSCDVGSAAMARRHRISIAQPQLLSLFSGTAPPPVLLGRWDGR